ncbi:ribosome hibernation-promoting factor, HPF/YfiA family [Ornithinimicrobium sediminis]|uniref:ribosome hibernation-promoting factor, HPF/YfiA family n=1 Tax=Ornithinimicrobium sediminis TaxID=2904603 RepID=UPI001E2A2664|nr:ribosome-associated translation inhibitor RaiA [Ornithinimicrobium sediminis]MCE0486481.1 ribosome-associated translation inhibitor RaiA [Ornithinimicrobium sediminis]
MDVTVTGRKKTVSDRYRRHLEDKLDKIPQLAPRVSRTEVVLTHEANPRLAKTSERVEITCYIKRTVVRAEAAADDEYAALDLAMSKLTERLRRAHDKRRISHSGKHRLPSVAEATFGLPTDPLGSAESEPEEARDPAEAVDEALGTEGNSPIELREKTHSSAPMTVGQALSRMELVGHDFFLFHDADTGLPSVVYRRRGWSYGVLRLDEALTETDDSHDEEQAAAAG